MSEANDHDRRGLLPAGVATPKDVQAALTRQSYLADDGLAVACYLALRLHRPVFLEGDAGVGKTSLAAALAGVIGAPLLRLQCYEGIDATQALYDWDFPRQLLHLRAAEAAATASGRPVDAASVEAELWSRRFLIARPLLAALETTPSVLLVDEIDRADDEFEAFLLELLSEFTVSIPELGTLRATVPPVVILTSNRSREVSDALKRRCLYHWVDHPGFEREVEIVRTRLPAASERLTAQVVRAVHLLRGEDLLKPPGVAETLDWTEALVALGADALDAELASVTLGSVLKYREDLDRARRLDVGAMISHVVAET